MSSSLKLRGHVHRNMSLFERQVLFFKNKLGTFPKLKKVGFYMKKWFVAMVLCLLLIGCAKDTQDIDSSLSTTTEEVTVESNTEVDGCKCRRK